LIISLKGMENRKPSSILVEQLISVDCAVRRVETLIRHLQASVTSSMNKSGFEDDLMNLALVPKVGTRDYFNWLTILLKNRTSMGEYLQGWIRDVSNETGASSIRRIRTIAAHICAQPLVVDAW